MDTKDLILVHRFAEIPVKRRYDLTQKFYEDIVIDAPEDTQIRYTPVSIIQFSDNELRTDMIVERLSIEDDMLCVPDMPGVVGLLSVRSAMAPFGRKYINPAHILSIDNEMLLAEIKIGEVYHYLLIHENAKAIPSGKDA